jgi:ribonuclease I
VIGKVHTLRLTLASDSLFVAQLASAGETWLAPLWAERRQIGCVRFSYVPPGSRTPRRYRCQPEEGDTQTRPQFTSARYGDSGYCQLRQSTSDKIRRGAHDESEMGVLHGLYQPQRETNLRVRMEEYLRFGLEAGLIYGS